jgi:hypothetical protein
MGLFDSNNASLQLLIGARQKKKDDELEKEKLAMQKRQNSFNDVLGAVGAVGNLAKAGFDAYDTLKLQPERESLAFDRSKELEGVKQQNAVEMAGVTHENALVLDKARMEHENFMAGFDRETQMLLANANIDSNKWMTIYKATKDLGEGERNRQTQILLSQMGIDANTAESLAQRLWQAEEGQKTRAWNTSERVAGETHETAMQDLSASAQKTLAQMGIDQDVWKTIYSGVLQSQESDKAQALERELTRYGIDQQMARQIASQAWQTSERTSSQDFQTAFAQLGSQLKKGELSYSADLEAKAAEKTNEYATALAGTNTKNAMQIAQAQSQLDLARDIALEGAKTESQKQLVELEYRKRSEENAQKYGYDVSLLSKQTDATKELETLKNNLGIARDSAGYDYQTRRDQILHDFDMAGKKFDADTQKEIVGMQTAAEQALAKAKADYDMVMALYQSGDAKESDVRRFEQQLELAKSSHANTMLQLEAEYGYKAALQDDDQAAAIDQIREKGAIDSAINKANNQNSLSVANINKSSDIAALQTRYTQEKESSILQGYSTPSVALGIAQTNARENLLSIGKREPTQLEINTEAAKTLQSDLGFFEGKGYTEAADVARRALNTIQPNSSPAGSPAGNPSGTHDYVPGAPPGMPQAGSLSFSVGPGAKSLMKDPEAWVDNKDGTEGRIVPNGIGGYRLETRPKSKK